MKNLTTLILGLALAGTFFATPALAQRTRSEDAKLLKQFDANENGWLDAAERGAAQLFQAANKEEGGRTGRRGGGDTELEPVLPGPKISAADVEQYPDVPLYDRSVLRTLFLEFENDNWYEELDAFYHTDVELPATLTADGTTYENVGVQHRGNSSFFATAPGRKKSMSITLDHVDKDQEIGGYRALTLLNAHADPTFLHSVLYLEIASEYLPAPKACFVRVVINGESWGIYINQQRYNKDFLRDAFKTTDGVRFKSANRSRGGGLSFLGEDPNEYRKWYEIKSVDKDESWTPLINVCRVLDETPAEELKSKLEPIFNIDGALRYLALDIVMMSGDGYWLHGSDFNLYLDKDGVLHMLHHDTNESFSAQGGRGGRGGGDEESEPVNANAEPFASMDDPNKALRQKLLVVPEFRKQYLEYIRDIARNSLDWEKLGPKVEAYRALIGPDVESDTHKLYTNEQFQTSVYGDGEENPPANTLKGFIQQRRNFLLNHPEIVALDESKK